MDRSGGNAAVHFQLPARRGCIQASAVEVDVMREILFRGKVISPDPEENGKWIFGQLVVRPVSDAGEDKCFICESGYRYVRCLSKMIRTYEVDPHTVGQYTGLQDAGGKRIFEGDIVKDTHMYSMAYAVSFSEGRGGWYPFACGDGCGCCEEDTVSAGLTVICGSIHDEMQSLGIEVRREQAGT